MNKLYTFKTADVYNRGIPGACGHNNVDDGKYMRLSGSNYWALGGIVGFSLQFRRLVIDLNAEYRSKPYYLVPDERYSEFLASLSVGLDGLLFKP